MQLPATTTRRDHWKKIHAETHVLLPGIPNQVTNLDGSMPAQLRIETSKSDRGIQTRATVVWLTEIGYTHAISFGDEGDYSRPVQTVQGRATEKKILDVHTDSLTYFDTIIADVARHYKVADPLNAPELEPA